MSSRLPSTLQPAVIVLAVVALDRITKIYIRMRVSGWQIYPVIPGFFNIVHTENPGAAFGVLADSSSPWRGLFLVGVSLFVMLVIGFLLWRPARLGAANILLLRTGLSLIFGGAVGICGTGCCAVPSRISSNFFLALTNSPLLTSPTARSRSARRCSCSTYGTAAARLL